MGDRWRYLRLDRAKAILAPPAAAQMARSCVGNPAMRKEHRFIEAWKFPEARWRLAQTFLPSANGRELAHTGA